jgi:hypothetical protein
LIASLTMLLDTKSNTYAKTTLTLEDKLACALGWSVEETRRFSAQSLRELVRPVSAALALEITDHIQSGYYVKGLKLDRSDHEFGCDCMNCAPWTL